MSLRQEQWAGEARVCVKNEKKRREKCFYLRSSPADSSVDYLFMFIRSNVNKFFHPLSLNSKLYRCHTTVTLFFFALACVQRGLTTRKKQRRRWQERHENTIFQVLIIFLVFLPAPSHNLTLTVIVSYSPHGDTHSLCRYRSRSAALNSWTTVSENEWNFSLFSPQTFP